MVRFSDTETKLDEGNAAIWRHFTNKGWSRCAETGEKRDFGPLSPRTTFWCLCGGDRHSLYDAAVTPCAQQLGALVGIIDKAAAHCATNKIEESALLQDRLYPDMFCLARQIRQSADFAMNTGGRPAGVTPPAMPAVDDTSFAAAKSRVETALGFVNSLTRAQVDGAEGKVIAWTGGGNDRKMKGNDYLQQFALPNFFFCNDGVQHPASSRRTARKAGLPRPGQLALVA